MNHRPARKLAIALSALALSAATVSCGNSESDGTAGPGSTSSDVQKAFELPTAEMAAQDVEKLPEVTAAADVSDLGDTDAPGYLYGVWDAKQGVHLAGIGLAEIDGEKPMSPTDSFRIGSVTKTFTATAVLLLVDDGKVDLDKPVADYTGDLTDPLPGGDTATVRAVLGMKSGWPEYSNNPAGPFGEVVTDPQHEFTASELVEAAAKEDPTPTDSVNYVNTNYVVLGDLVEQVSGTSFSSFVKKRILDPIGLDQTVIPDPTKTADPTSHGYLNAGWADFEAGVTVPPEVLAAGGSGTDVSAMSTSVGGAAGNGVSTLADLATWAAADFGNVLLSDASRKARVTGSPADDLLPGTTYGLGLQMLGDWHFHGGEIFGWETQVFANPKTRQVVVVNGNACCGLALQNIFIATGTFPEDPDLAKLDADLKDLLGG